MSESLLQNMSAPPRSKIVVAPNKVQPTYWKLALLDLPEASAGFDLAVVKHFGFHTIHELTCAVQSELARYQLPPIAMIASKASHSKLHPSRLVALGILTRSAGNLYMARRPIRLDPVCLGQTLFIPINLLQRRL